MIESQSSRITELISHMENLEKEKQNFPMIFTEILKDEINANDESCIYKGVKEIARKYSKDEFGISIINEFIKTLSGGASLDEIMQVAIDEISYSSSEFKKEPGAFFNLSSGTT